VGAVGNEDHLEAALAGLQGGENRLAAFEVVHWANTTLFDETRHSLDL
jgi:hypothetical protein